MRAQRHAKGSVRFDKRRKTWNYLWYDGTTRRSRRLGTKQELPTKAAAWAAAEGLKADAVEVAAPAVEEKSTVQSIVARYESERMPTRRSTARVYRCFLRKHILPAWGAKPIQALEPRPVELWLRSLPLAPKSKTHVRSLLYGIVDYAMWAGDLALGRNPISLVQNKGATKGVRKPRSLTVEEFQSLLGELHAPHDTIALVSVCLGLRISETLGLVWSDVDWLGSKLKVSRGIVNGVADELKTKGSAATFKLTPELLQRLKDHRSRALADDLAKPSDWVFASPLRCGRLPYSYTGVWRELQRAAKAANLGSLGTHSMRHTYRSWLDAVGSSLAVQQRMMRHADIRTTMNIYGDVVTDEMHVAGSGVSNLAFSTIGAQSRAR